MEAFHVRQTPEFGSRLSFRVTVEVLDGEELVEKRGALFETRQQGISEVFVKTILDRVANTIKSYRGLP